MVKINPVKKEKPKMDKSAVKPKKENYLEGVGRRKTAIARVRLTPQKGKDFSVNKKTLAICFPTADLQKLILSPLDLTECLEQFAVSVQVKGGGMNAQAEAIRHGISRALVLFNPEFRKKLKDEGYLKRDPRMRERKKFGLKRARKSPQWAKR
jgi:small subunit ribosomal protein S9